MITFDKLPKTVDEMINYPGFDLKNPEMVAAMTVAAFARFPESKEDCYNMINYLRGPRQLSHMDKQFIRDRFMDNQDYIPRSYFKGATPENNYTPDVPYTLDMRVNLTTKMDDQISYMVHSGGADNDRSIRLRLKPSTGEWFLWEQYILVGIRKPAALDDWA